MTDPFNKNFSQSHNKSNGGHGGNQGGNKKDWKDYCCWKFN